MIKFLGHASIYVKTDKISIVIDPWFSKTGTYQFSWFQFPDNTDIDFSWVDDLDYVCLSHEHIDHYDVDFLKTLNRKTKIVTANFNNKRFLKSLADNLDNEIIEVNHKDTFLLGDIKYTPIVQVPMGHEDSTMIFEIDNEVIVNFNDMKPSHKDITWISDNFDVTYLFKQFSGASWYPLLYDYDDKKMYELCKDKRLFKYEVILDMIKQINPKVYVPCAGPPAFLDDDVFDLNFLEENTFSTQSDIYNFFKQKYPEVASKIVVLMPGDSISSDMDFTKISEKNIMEECFVNKKKYLSNYKNRRNDIITDGLSKIDEINYSLYDKCVKYFYPLMVSAKDLCYNIGNSILLNITGQVQEKIIVDFSGKLNKNSIRYFNGDEYFYEFTLDGKWLNQILDKKITWEQFFLSLRFKARRNPDEYSEHLMAFLKLADPVSYRKYENFHFSKVEGETFILDFDGQEYKCQKYCPHSRGDLSKGRVADGKLVCPVHNWKFSLPDGQCTTNKSSLTIEVV